MPSVAGLLMLTAGIFNILWLVSAFTQILDIKELLRITWVISPLPYIILDIGFGGNTFLASVIALIFILGILSSVIGGVFAMIRSRWGLALAGSVGAFVCVPLLGVLVILLIIISKHLFVDKRKSHDN